MKITSLRSLSRVIGILVMVSASLCNADMPLSFSRQVKQVEFVDVVVTEDVDLTAVRQEDQERERRGGPYRFAVRKPTRISVDTGGTWEQIDSETILWRLHVVSPGATSISLGFTTYRMPTGGKLFIYSVDGKEVLGPYTERDNAAHGQLWTPIINYDDVVVELTVPTSEIPGLGLELTSINHGYRELKPLLADEGTKASEWCEIDVACSEGNNWRDQIRSVAKYYITLAEGQFVCTGALVNNTAEDNKPYFLTAFHCFDEYSDGFLSDPTGVAATMIVTWNYQATTCGGATSEPTQVQTGAYFRAASCPSDFALVELDEMPSANANVYYAGWDRSGSTPSSGVAIHHPANDLKKISIENDPLSIVSVSLPCSSVNAHFRISDWDTGTTEGGSSGCPLFNPQKRVVGQLTGGKGSDLCVHPRYDYFGRFYTSWTGGDSSSTRLSNWLDPLGSGVMTLDGKNPSGGCYCSAFGGGDEYIYNVTLGSIDNTTGYSGYADYTEMSTTMAKGQGYLITVINGDPYFDGEDQCRVWIDWNRDCDFDDAGEAIIMSDSPGPGPYTATIIPPGTALEGSTRMRVRIRYTGSLISCGETTFGEVEDYTIIVESEPTYCPAEGGCWEEIGTVLLGDIVNTDTGCDNYADYTSLSTTMETGTGYELTVINPNTDHGDRCGVWVDWNQDFDFEDAGETISVSGDPSGGEYTATITPPATAATGDTRMRIRITWDEPATPCGPHDWGEVEDYTITVESPPPPPITISGYVKKADASAVSGVLLSASTGQTDTSDASGYYELEFIPPWSGTITPTKTNYRFTPINRTYTNVSADISNQNFTAKPVFEASADAYVSYDFPTTNYGTETKLTIGKKSGAGYTIYLKFDLSSIPANQAVYSANLHLYAYEISTTSPGINPRFVSDDSWEETEINGDNAPPSTADSTPTVVNPVVPGDNYWDVSTRVDQSYITDGIYSVQIIYVTSSASEYYANFASREHPTPSMRPYLEIVYDEAFCGGTGTPDDPYLICTGEQMNNIGRLKARWDSHYKLMNDISLAAYTGSAYNIIGTSPPQTGSRTPFTGVFDGDYHSISDFSYSTYSKVYVGLFGYVHEGAIRNLKIIAPNITDPGYDDMRYVGALAGIISNTDVSGCSVIGGTVEGEESVGGLVGVAQGYIANCSSSASVSGGSEVGGLAGAGSTFGALTNISDSYAQGAVSGDNYVGGFVGDSSDMIITNCYSTGVVIGDSNVGGFSGYNVNQFPISDNVTGCFWDVESSSEPDSAAGTPLPTADMYDQTTFTDSGWDFVGETANGGSDDWAMPAGGGYPVMWYQLSPWPALPSFAAGSGTEEDPYEISTELELNRIGHNPRLIDKHFELITDIDMAGMKYYMIAHKPYVFTGTFDGMGHTISNISIESEFDTSPFGFIANIYGSSASIQNLTLDEPNIASTWGWRVGSLTGLNESGSISNCHAVNANVIGMSTVGGLVGINYKYGKISGCSATGNVSENTLMSVIFSGAGGLVGENTYWSEIENSFAKCNVSGDDCLGGHTGINAIYSTVTNCYSQGSVSGTEDYIGGLVGRNIGATELDYCYSATEVNGPAGSDSVGSFVGKMGVSGTELYTACFWDSELNPDMNGIGNGSDPDVTGLPTVQMQTRSTFTDAGWDFVDEVINGTNDIWKINEGDYPRLAWEQEDADIFVQLDLSRVWMYQSLPGQTNSRITAEVNEAGFDDPLGNSSYSFYWEIDLPSDVSVGPVTVAGGQIGDSSWEFAAPSCNETAGLSDSGQTFTVRVTIVGDDYGNYGTAERQFAIALLGDVNNDAMVDLFDRVIFNAFWKGESAPATFEDCDLSSDGLSVDLTDRVILNAVWGGDIGSTSVGAKCPLRDMPR